MLWSFRNSAKRSSGSSAGPPTAVLNPQDTAKTEVNKMTYCPNSDENWETLSPRQAGFDQARLTDAIAFAGAHEYRKI